MLGKRKHESVDENETPSKRSKQFVGKRQLKYNELLPDTLRSHVQDECEQLNKEVMQLLHDFFAQDNIFQKLHHKAQWDKFDTILTRMKRYICNTQLLHILKIYGFEVSLFH